MKKIFFVLIVSFLLSAPCWAIGEWNQTGNLDPGRSEFCSVILDDGRVLVAGGFIGCYETSSCMIYNQITGEWATTDSLSYPAANFTLTKLSNGKILAIYGIFSEIFDPLTGIWSGLTTLNFHRIYHSAVLLQDGNVLVVGGDYQNNYQSSEIYNSETNEWTLTGFCAHPKLRSTLELLTDGRVMAIGGGNSNYQYCEIYDYNTGIWSEIAPLNDPRYGHTSHLLSNGNVMVIAGTNGNIFLNSCEIYDFQTQEWTFADSLEIGRTNHCSETLLNNKILVMGGQGETGSGSGYSCEIYNPITNQWETTASTYGQYNNSSSEILNDERVLVMKVCSELYTWNYTPIVSQPQTLSGLNEAIVGEILTFSVTAFDPDNDSFLVRIDWGDNHITDWADTTLFSHSWTEPGVYQVRAQVADQWYFLNELCHNSISDWTEPLIVTILGIPEISVSADSLNFGSVYIGSDSMQTIAISNIGNGTLTANAYTNTDEFSVYPTTFNIEPGETLDVEITFSPTYEGIISDTLIILSNDPENPEVSISLTGKGEVLVGVDSNIMSVNSIRAYPNPFNASITISFSLDEVRPHQTEISIYNIKGQLIKELSINDQSAIWNGRDANGNSVASGIYFYKMDSGRYTANKKIVLMK